MEDKIVDLDVIKPQQKKIKIAGKEIDLSIIPFERILDVIENIDTVDENDKGYTKAILGNFNKVMRDILKDSDKEITDEWIDKNIDYTRMLALIQEIIMPLFQDMNINLKAPLDVRQNKKKE